MYLSWIVLSIYASLFLILWRGAIPGLLGACQSLVSVLLTVHREEASRLFKQSPFFVSWHPEVLELYANYRLTADTSNGVRLKTLLIHESLTFAETHVPDEVGVLLEQLDGNMTVRWIVPALG